MITLIVIEGKQKPPYSMRPRVFECMFHRRIHRHLLEILKIVAMFHNLLSMLAVNEFNLRRLKSLYSMWLIIYIIIIAYHLYFMVSTMMELPEMSRTEHEYYTHTLYLLAATFIGLIFEVSSVVTGLGAVLVFDKRSVSGHSIFAVCCLTVSVLPTFLCDIWYHKLDYLIPFNLIFILHVISVLIIFVIKTTLYQPDHTRFYTSHIV
jgi:hypothetical protein